MTGGALVARIGRRCVQLGPNRDVDVDHDVLGLCGAGDITQGLIDVLHVAGVVALADRTHRRTTATSGWSREIEVQVPVSDPDRWVAVAQPLVDCLEYVTGDSWSFTFTRGIPTPIQRSFAPNTTFSVVVPFSGGMDSYLLRQELRSRDESPLPVTARTSAFVSRLAHDVAQAPACAGGAPVRLKSGTHAEDTFRTRTFLFGCVAAVAAVIADTRRIAIAESGQGSIGSSVVRFGNEVPYRTTHPLFTERLRRFLQAVGVDVDFTHPYLWRTKGSVLGSLIKQGHAGDWRTTSSCSRNMRRAKSVGDDRACGICGNCILRRVAIHSAGVEDKSLYHWGVRESSLENAVAPGGKTATTKTDRGIAARGVIGMQAFASMRDDDPTLRCDAHAMSTMLNIPRDVVAREQSILLAQHRAEWRAFLQALPENSWVRQYTEEADALAA